MCGAPGSLDVPSERVAGQQNVDRAVSYTRFRPSACWIAWVFPADASRASLTFTAAAAHARPEPV